MRTTYGLPVCQTCFDNLMEGDENVMLFYLDLCATHFYENRPIDIQYNEDDYLADDYINELESMGLIKTIDHFNNPNGIRALPCFRQQLDKFCYCSEEKKHFGK